MARQFARVSDEFIDLGVNGIGPLFNGAPAISCHCRMRAFSLIGGGGNSMLRNTIVSISIGGSHVQENIGFAMNVSHNDRRLSVHGKSRTSDSLQLCYGYNSIVNVNSDYNVGGVNNFANDTQRIYIDGANTDDRNTTFGASTYLQGTPVRSDSISSYSDLENLWFKWDGVISELAFWADDIGDQGFEQLHRGANAQLVRPDALVFYMPLLGRYDPELDYVSGKTGDLEGSIERNATYDRQWYRPALAGIA